MKKTDFEYDMAKHEKFFYVQLLERQKRLFAALQVMQIGCYWVKEVSEKFGLHIHTVRRGKNELLLETVPPAKKVCQKAAAEKKRYSSAI
jgi:hypothetical protein